MDIKKREYENVSPLNFILRVSFGCDDYAFFEFLLVVISFHTSLKYTNHYCPN